jgi:hypothetical protein
MKTVLPSLDIGQTVSAMGIGISNAQQAMDRFAITMARSMGEIGDGKGWTAPSGQSYSLLDLGFTPSFYQFSEAIFDVKIAMSMTVSREADVKASAKSRGFGLPIGPRISAVNAQYSSKFQYSSKSASRINTTLKARPVPTVLESRLEQRRELNDAMKEAAS